MSVSSCIVAATSGELMRLAVEGRDQIDLRGYQVQVVDGPGIQRAQLVRSQVKHASISLRAVARIPLIRRLQHKQEY